MGGRAGRLALALAGVLAVGGLAAGVLVPSVAADDAGVAQVGAAVVCEPAPGCRIVADGTTPAAPLDSEPSANPFAVQRLFVDPASHAARSADAVRSSDPETAALFDRIATRPQADWFGDWNPVDRVAAAVRDRVDTITAADALPVLVTYAVPLRDCGGYSAGGARSADAYRAWIREFARGIGDRPAVVVVEPDALGQLDCLPPDDRQVRLELLADAIATLTSRPKTAVYLDAGHSDWVPAATMARRLRDSGVGMARGFSLNVSNYRVADDELAYGRALSAATGGKRFIVDTSRNGLGPGSTWCNPPGRALGPAATTATGEPAADAFFWIKRPGESDGECGRGEPPAGQWWPEYALGLARRAGAGPATG